MDKNRSQDTIELGYHVVAFFDLMGQQDKLRKLTQIPEDRDSKEFKDLLQLLRQTYGAVSGMRTAFESFFESYGNQISLHHGVPEDKQGTVKKMANIPVKFHQFSDFVVAYLPLRHDDDAQLPIRGVAGLLNAAASTILPSLAAGHPIRGGIDIGANIEINRDELYGASLAKAYALESKLADYPRVVIGPDLQDYLFQIKNIPQKTDLDAISSNIASRCLDLLAVDIDGVPIIDFIGPAVLDLAHDPEGKAFVKDTISKAYTFVIESSAAFRKSRNSKLAFKYSLLRDYMESRLDVWGIEKQN